MGPNETQIMMRQCAYSMQGLIEGGKATSPILPPYNVHLPILPPTCHTSPILPLCLRVGHIKGHITVFQGSK